MGAEISNAEVASDDGDSDLPATGHYCRVIGNVDVETLLVQIVWPTRKRTKFLK